jgi:aminoglycoside phosphotransferase (APT) family kinase protein
MSSGVDNASGLVNATGARDPNRHAEGLRRWFDQAWPDAEILDVRNLGYPANEGMSNETLLFDLEWRRGGERHEERLVARIEPPEGGMWPRQRPELDVSVELQHRVMTALARETSVPLPPLHPYEADVAYLGRPFFVMGFVPGGVPDIMHFADVGYFAEDVDAAQRRSMIERFLEILGEIHNVDWRRAGLEWLDPSGVGRPDMAQQIGRYREAATRVLGGRAHPVLFAALDRLERDDPHDERVGITWGDARLGNVMWQGDRAMAVLDWEGAALCPTEADLGWWFVCDSAAYEDPDAGRLPGHPTREEMIACYERVSGREVRDPAYWELFTNTRACFAYLQLGDRMTAMGTVPAELEYGVRNRGTDMLADLLGIENPTPSASPE